MRIQPKHVKVGDVAEVKIGDKLAYVQYADKHKLYGEMILVSPCLHETRPLIGGKVFDKAYFAFYPISAAVAQGLIHAVDNMPVPRKLPERFKRALRRSGRRVESWVIEGAGREVIKTSLSDDEVDLPIVAIWNHEMLIHRIVEGWTPANPVKRS